MKILMVRPQPPKETIGLQHLMVVEPLELEVLAALIRPVDTVILADMILERKPLDYFLQIHAPDVLCITGYITNVGTIIENCALAKKMLPTVATVVGGVHCEVCPEDFDHPAIDFRVVRNATTTFTHLLNCIEGNSKLPRGILSKGEIFDESKLPPFDFAFPMPNRTIAQHYKHKYFYIFHNKVALIKTSFGCPYSCSFCFCREITRGLYKQRPIDEILDELELIPEKEIYIVDDDFLADAQWLNHFIEGCKERNIQKSYLVYGRADFIARNPELIHRLKKIGLRTVIVGFESFSNQELDKYNKNTNPEMYAETMRILHREKIDCFATIIVSPEWDKSDFRNMVKTVKKLGIHYVNLQPLTPLPKTGLSISEEKIIVERNDYPKWDLAHVTVRPEKMSVSDFYREILKAYNSILFQPKVLWLYLRDYTPAMLWKMIIGSIRVGHQYRQKIKEAERYA
jgi:hopanoid C-3 methylase